MVSAHNPPKGFTLIELMVVISIIAILSVIGMTVFQGAQKSARDAKRREDLHAISLALMQYYYAKGVMPANQTTGGYNQTQPNFLHELVEGGFMTEIPKDPQYPQSAYGYFDYGPGHQAGALLVTQYESGDASTHPPGTCRPWPAGTNWCDQSSTKYYCICNPY